MSVRLRLTLLYSGILAFTLLALGLTVYWIQARLTLRVLEDALADEAQRLMASPRFQLEAIDNPARKLAAPETYVQTRRPDGEILDRTANLEGAELPLSLAGLAAIRQGRTWVEVADTENGRLLVYSLPVRQDGQIRGVLQLGRSLADYDQAQGTLERILLAGSLAALAAAFASGWLLAGMALRPIHQITQTARAIGRLRDFGQRVPYSGPSDEIGELARTFNAMLEELQAAYVQLEHAFQAQRRFVADASHELRTPLTTMRGNLELLRREPPIPPQDQREVLEDLIAECDRLIRLVNDLLALARAEAGQAPRREPVPLRPFLSELGRQARRLARGQTIETPEAPEASALADPDLLKQVLLILIDNAIRYTPSGGRITLRAQAGETFIALDVQDTGPGIPPEILPHIFERFFRGDPARTGSGAGLGLSIARALVEAMGGTIEVESQVGRGSTFTIRLPRAIDEASSGATP
ncbi:sensor histidine kinase [Thermoflexus sp.]|uniref:sensor histidine kinase n=1 Tax=Thermoflexus sp. TaxID=1969742 RepID=UPI0025E6B07C|nr:HAMP domain-containing sensor histidine kinase [Thermoflexus sp.]MDW8179923.1 HAMP domain-containing sensor histidine kinase [Anaerolineae bacterium]MCS6964036.1 HAMP domain-containing histidine kinase [Thermoflexus sp.]MCS7350472.1 HAMP domain-containing histidine kinase [Thermoflexus sp.]MCX7689337.1 HAMP domain-containing histidine kinase [Thermoflexus sp.]MDW8183874.1 HAMP domain-containing sensor histidine kinase [Anaerolineae bacterium]